LKTLFTKSFERDLRGFRDEHLRQQVLEAIRQVQEAARPDEIHHLKKLKGYAVYYRVRLGDYRLGLKVEGNEVTFMRLLHRRDIYRYFP